MVTECKRVDLQLAQEKTW